MRIGPRIGLRIGLSIGPEGGDPMAGVSQDATRGVYVPATDAEWTIAMAAAGISSGNPMAAWLMQAAADPTPDEIADADLTTTGSVAFQQTVTGWDRDAVEIGDVGGFNAIINNTDADLPDVSATSALVLAYIQITGAPAADRGVLCCGDMRATVTSTLLPKIGNGTNTGTGGSSVTDAVRPWVLQQNRTASTSELFTDLEKVSATFAESGATKRVFFGGAFDPAPGMKMLYGALFKGAAAELTDAQIRTLLETLGWTVSW